ncbi:MULTISPECIES: tetratricopeptide repeat protein [Moorena]|uniref:Tetratricopeptide repeat protein n=1 Tax=Moorena producens 3L TaxID=489825 RepID=F4Y0F8_9CYAN|nr:MULTISPECIES: tetratricopeptide repeat protein [Moorena]EGJ29748.1 hypothetical protein LYNGBM3L_60830 [Moorena producens 3L]NEP68129.1 tetratricopeptide repeat protein [Moorena sp. SIO3A5]NEQ10865.1 tetratricopeptide repeat protein [Moorena sp. SIO4E2]NER90516.1 tetratricopeptide repeat protein [Moorena sp. SIO3A2]NES43721.1 tetratricopeptide repeat protein [Moorena sp. SIO2C4]
MSVYTPQADPINCLITSRNLGHLHFNQRNWQPAIDAYQQAITAVEISRSEAINDPNRQQMLAQAITVYQGASHLCKKEGKCRKCRKRGDFREGG